jgi:hypothetical protein
MAKQRRAAKKNDTLTNIIDHVLEARTEQEVFDGPAAIRVSDIIYEVNRLATQNGLHDTLLQVPAEVRRQLKRRGWTL